MQHTITALSDLRTQTEIETHKPRESQLQLSSQINTLQADILFLDYSVTSTDFLASWSPSLDSTSWSSSFSFSSLGRLLLNRAIHS